MTRQRIISGYSRHAIGKARRSCNSKKQAHGRRLDSVEVGDKLATGNAISIIAGTQNIPALATVDNIVIIVATIVEQEIAIHLSVLGIERQKKLLTRVSRALLLG